MLLPPPGAAAGLHLPLREPFRSKTSLSALFKPSLEARSRERCKEGAGVLCAQAEPQPLWVRLCVNSVWVMSSCDVNPDVPARRRGKTAVGIDECRFETPAMSSEFESIFDIFPAGFPNAVDAASASGTPAFEALFGKVSLVMEGPVINAVSFHYMEPGACSTINLDLVGNRSMMISLANVL